MNPFLKEHAAPLVGSAMLHLIIAAAAIAATLWTVAPHLRPPAAIEAYIAARPAPRPAPPAPAPAAAPAPAPVVEPAPPPAPDPAIAERASAEARALHAEEMRLAEAKREAGIAARHRAEVAEEATREVKRRAAAAAESQRRTDEAKRSADAALEAQRRAETAERAARESDLARQLAQEEHREGAARSGLLDRYITEIQARIERAWNRPPTARPGLSCTVFVSQVPGGTVTSVRLGECNGDAAVQQSITLAVFRASPLPMPSDPSLFERNLRLIFEPHER